MKTAVFNKGFKRIITILLACVMAGSAFACGDKSGPGGGGGGGGRDERPPAVETGKFILKSGVLPYQIVVGQNAGSLEQMAADEVQSFFFEATGYEIPIVDDSGLTYSVSGQYISVGRTALLSGAQVTVDDTKLGGSGYIIVTKGDSIFVVGATGYGTVYGAYDLLGEMLNYEYFFEGCYSLDKNVSEVKLMGYDITEIPDIEFRTANYTYYDFDTANYYNLRVRQFTEPIANINDKAFHNCLDYIKTPPVSVTSDPAYAVSAPKWLNAAGNQLCYTAKGDAKAYELMQATCLDAVQKALIRYPDRNIVTLTMDDYYDYCNCQACLANTNYYGANSANNILFLNDLNRAVRAWFETPAGALHKRDLKLIFFAYHDAVQAPTKGGLKCDPGVGVWYAPINEADFTKPITHSFNIDAYNLMNAWAPVADGVYLWIYSTIFYDYLSPFDTFNSMQSYYQMAKSIGAKYIFDQGQYSQGAATGWSVLKIYLNAKLAWNVDADMGKLINRFFDGYFGEASAEMRAFFDSYRMHSEYIKAEQGFGGIRSIYINAAQEKFFPKGVLQDWKTKIDAAIAKIEPLKTSDPERYQVLYDHIALERLSVLYLWIKLYDYNTFTDVITNFKLTFKADADRIGLTESQAGAPIELTYAAWGI
ncbi:MAG: DUF4838 domain-containing protein [Firmicutes bacterium]|nr:DUF4838 domain-containing protein [Bacillota bacterium]